MNDGQNWNWAMMSGGEKNFKTTGRREKNLARY